MQWCALASYKQTSFVVHVHWAWHVRRSSRFFKIRPFGLSVLSLAGLSLFIVSATLAEALQFPCAVRAFLYPVGIALLATNLVFSGMTVSLEARYAFLAKTQLIKDDDSSHMSLSTTRFSKMGLVMELFLGIRRAKHLKTLEEINGCKDILVPSLCLYSLPGFIAGGVLMLSVPQYSCSECQYLYMETNLAIYLVFAVYLYSCFIAYYDVYSAVGWDQQGVFQEFVLLLVCVGPVALVALVTMAIDPFDLMFLGVFNWQALWILAELVWWYVLRCSTLLFYNQ